MLRRTTWVLTERRVISGGGRRDASTAGKLPHAHRLTPVPARAGRVMGHAHSGAQRAAATLAARPPRARFADPMDEILPVQDGLDADFPDELSAAAMAPRLTRRPPPPRRETTEHDVEEDEDEEYETAHDARDVAALAGRSSALADADADADVEEEEDEALEADRADYGDEVDGEPEDDDAEAPHAVGELELAETDAAVEVGEDADSANMEEAYRFLLHHIDAEMAAIQRRQEDVKHRRQQKEVHYKHTVKDLFEMMESPWQLIPDAVGMPLPATGMDVYVKEELTRRHAKDSSHQTLGDAQNKMLHLALEKNYRSFPAARKQPYEVAGKHNALRRHELQSRLHKGCAKFESYLENVKECTADMVRRGDVSQELPTVGQHPSHPHHARQPLRPKARREDDGSDGTGSATRVTAPRKAPRSSGGGGGGGGTARNKAASSSPASADPSLDVDTSPKTKSNARKHVKRAAVGSDSASVSASASASATARTLKATPAKKSGKATRARVAPAKTTPRAKKAAGGAVNKSSRGRASAVKKPVVVKRGGDTRTASIPLPTIPGLRVKAKGTKPTATAKKKAAGASAKSKGKKKK